MNQFAGHPLPPSTPADTWDREAKLLADVRELQQAVVNLASMIQLLAARVDAITHPEEATDGR